MSILIISEPNDVHAHAVMDALKKSGETDAHLVDFSAFPQQMAIDMRLDARGPNRLRLQLADGKLVDMAEVRAVWWRRPQAFGHPVQGMAPLARHFAMTESATAFQGMWQASDCLWVNNVVRDAAAAHKPWQLSMAKQCGLTIPDTLMTTIPSRVRQFFDQHDGAIIYKPFLQTFHSWRETRKLKREEFDQLDNVKLAPVIFQELVPGRADLRVTVIGETILPAAVDITKMEYQLDVRLNQQAYERHDLPAEIQKKLLELMRRLGLEYGAIDLRQKPDGDYVFFEVNPAGQFLFVEYACNLPISQILADHLARGTKSQLQTVSALRAA